MPEDLRTLALAQAAELESMAMLFPAGEPGREWLLKAATRLKNAYTRPRCWQMVAVLHHISEGCRSASDLIEELGISRRDLRGMLAELCEDGYCTERIVRLDGQMGRPATWYELTKEGEVIAQSFVQ